MQALFTYECVYCSCVAAGAMREATVLRITVRTSWLATDPNYNHTKHSHRRPLVMFARSSRSMTALRVLQQGHAVARHVQGSRDARGHVSFT